MDNFEQIYEWFINNVKPKINKSFLLYLKDKLKENFNEDLIKDLLLQRDANKEFLKKNDSFIIKSNRLCFIKTFEENKKIINNFKLKLDSKNKTRLIKIN